MEISASPSDQMILLLTAHNHVINQYLLLYQILEKLPKQGHKFQHAQDKHQHNNDLQIELIFFSMIVEKMLGLPKFEGKFLG